MEEAILVTRADLHVHTTHSDGRMTPEQVVEHARKKGLKAIAVTDHDIVSAVKAAQQMGEKYSIEIIPGIEMSTLWEDQEIHILGYFVDIYDPKLLEALDKQRDVRFLRNQMMIEKLQKIGIPITLEEVMERKIDNDQRNIGRPHIAEVLIAKGIVRTMDEAFDRYLGRNGQAYLTPDRISPVEAIRLIHQSGGVAVIAHPGLYQKDEIIPLFVEEGLDGLEVDHPDHTDEDRQRYQAIATRYQLIATAGSDFHGERNGSMYHADLGTCTVPYRQVEKLKQKALK